MTSQAYLYILVGICILGAGYQTQTGWLYFMGATSLGLVPLAWFAAWWQLRGLRARVLPVAPAYQGGNVAFGLTLEREAVGKALGLQALLPDKPDVQPRSWWRGHLIPEGWRNRTVEALANGERQAIGFSPPAGRRGEFPLPTFYIQSAFPLGLVALTRAVHVEGHYLVFPVGPHVPYVPWLDAAARERGERQRFDQGHGTSPRSVREYRSGDPWRLIHWRTTARRGTPHVKETERELGEALVLYLDLRSEVHTDATLEHMVAIATSLLDHARAHGREVVLLTQPEATPSNDGASDHELAWLARVTSHAGIAQPLGPDGSVLLSPAYVAGWQHWATQFVYCPGTAANAMDATAFCPVGSSIPEALGREARA
jgi:uncharacterized protein (DUF58 family)